MPHPLVESADIYTEVLSDLRERDVGIAVLRDADHVVAELLGKRLGHDDILPGEPFRLATFDVNCSYIRPSSSDDAVSMRADLDWDLHGSSDGIVS